MDLRGKRFGLYTPLGYPDKESFSSFIEAAGKYVDIIEIGIPTERPIYDGPIIRKAHREIIYKGYSRVLSDYPALSELRCGKVALAYYSEVRGALGRVLGSLSELGFRCLLAPDLLIEYPEELEAYVRASEEYGLEPCFFISPKFPYSMVKRLPDYRPYMVYLGLQASTGSNLPIQVLRNISIARNLLEGRAPLAVGFGINSVERMLAILAGGADIAIVGTEILRRLSRGVEEALSFVLEAYRALRDPYGG